MDIDKHAARVAASIFKAVDERHELLPYMKRHLMNSIILNINTLTEQEIDFYIASSRLRELLDVKANKEG